MLADLIEELTTVYRKGPVVREHVTAGVRVVDVMAYPKAPPEAETRIDVHFFEVVVNPEAGARYGTVRDALEHECPDLDRLAQGPSYIEVGGWLGDQELAMRLFALGQAYGWWKVIIPERLGFSGPEADAMAGSGYVMVSGYDRTGSDVQHSAKRT